MPSIFPNNGVAASEALNTVDVDTTNCTDGELFYSTDRCQPRFNPAAANAVMSELLNLGTCVGEPWDCSRLDNLCRAMEQIIRANVLNMVANNELLSADAGNLLKLGSDDLLYYGTPGSQGFAFEINDSQSFQYTGNTNTGDNIPIRFAGTEAPTFIDGLTWNNDRTLTAAHKGWYYVTAAWGGRMTTSGREVTNVHGYKVVNGVSTQVWRRGNLVQGGSSAHFAGGGGFSYAVLLDVGDTLETHFNFVLNNDETVTSAYEIDAISYSAVLMQDLGQ